MSPMRTPAGSECKYFFGDYYRGKNREECRLLGEPNQVGSWSPDLCKTCPVPGIIRANACENLVLHGQVVKSLMTGFRRRVIVAAYCLKTEEPVREPHVGCGLCHTLPPVYQADQNK